MFTVYILQSIRNGRYYIGHTEDVASRLAQHNRGAVRSTKIGMPWKVVFMEQYQTRSEAHGMEQRVKKYKGGVQFRALLDGTIKKR